MRKKRFDGMNCTIARALDQVGDWWTLLIIREATQGSTRFDEFQGQLGIARNILTARLERLVELGIMERFPLENRANTEGYRLTRKGEDLYPVIVTLKQWGDRWAAPDGKPTTRLVTADSGDEIETITVHGPDGKALSFRDIRFTPGPGATAATKALIESRNRKVLGEA